MSLCSSRICVSFPWRGTGHPYSSWCCCSFSRFCVIYKPFSPNPQSPGQMGRRWLCCHGSYASCRNMMSRLPTGLHGVRVMARQGGSHRSPRSLGIPPLHLCLYSQAGSGSWKLLIDIVGKKRKYPPHIPPMDDVVLQHQKHSLWQQH